MLLLDENIIASQKKQLLAWGIPVRQIGADIGRKGTIDRDHIIPLLHRLRRPTLFTRDLGFYGAKLCHDGYCIVCLQVRDAEVAKFIRRFLRHPAFRTSAQRMGKVVKVTALGITYWQRRRLVNLLT